MASRVVERDQDWRCGWKSARTGWRALRDVPRGQLKQRQTSPDRYRFAERRGQVPTHHSTIPAFAHDNEFESVANTATGTAQAVNLLKHVGNSTHTAQEAAARAMLAKVPFLTP